jgi:hypothetical protein
VLLGQTARALPGTHAPAISTYDTRASSVVVAYRHGSSDAGPFDTFSYNANFSSTSGKLSAQFGIHYLNFAAKDNDSTAHGVGASGVALFVFPVAGRYEDGTPKAAISFDVGAVPTAYISGQRNYLTVPLVLGFGVPLSPQRAITITPWFEAAPSANLDTVFKPANITFGPGDVNINEAAGTASLNQSAVESAVEKGVSVNFSFVVPMRAGLEGDIHLGEAVDLNLYSSVSSLGGGFAGSSVLSLGGGLTFRWDDIVPTVLPPERRLEREGCDAIETRFRSCPNAHKWLTPEERVRALSLPVNATKLTPTRALPVQRPTPPIAPAAAAPRPIAPGVPAPAAAQPASAWLPRAPNSAPPNTGSTQDSMTAPPAGKPGSAAPPSAVFPN